MKHTKKDNVLQENVLQNEIKKDDSTTKTRKKNRNLINKR